MNFPSINLNLFKRLEYFLFLIRNNRRFDVQLNKLIEKKYKGAYPTWEIEKKILYWSYWGHKHLGRGVTKNHFDSMHIDSEEQNKINPDKIFENLIVIGFFKQDKEDKKIYVITKEGLEFSCLIWDVYYLNAHRGVYKAEYKLRKSLDFWFNVLQIISIFLLTPILIFFAIINLINYDKLLVLLKNIDFLNFLSTKINTEILLGILQLFCFILCFLFIFGFIADVVYRFILRSDKIKNKYYIEHEE